MRTPTLTVAVGVLVILLFTSNPALGQGQVFWQENGVVICEGTFEGGMWPLAIVEDGSGGGTIAWADSRGTYESVYAQRVDKDGNCLWASNGVCLRTDTWFPDRISAVSDGKGGAIIVWKDRPNPSVPPQVRAQRVDSSGVVRWGSGGVIVASDTGDIDYWPAVVTDGRGGAIVAWVIEIIDTTVVFNLYAQRVDSSGSLQWAPGGLLVKDNDCLNDFPELASDGQFGAIIAWPDSRSGAYDIYAQRLDGNGSELWTATGIPVCAADSIQAYPAILSDLNAEAIVVWHDKRDGDWDSYAQRTRPDGSFCWSPDGIDVCSASGDQTRPRVVNGDSSDAVVVWIDNRSGFYDIYSQNVDSSGTLEWDTLGVFVGSTSSSEAQRPVLVEDGRSGALVTWRDLRAGDWDIYCQRVDSSGSLRWGVNGLPVCTHPEGQDWGPVMVETSEGGAIIAWGDRRPPGLGASIYAQRVGNAVGIQEEPEIVDRMHEAGLLRNTPNPFTGKTVISFNAVTLDGEAKDSVVNVSLTIYDVTGKLVKRLVRGRQKTGFYTIVWDGRDDRGGPVPSGIYFYRLTADDLTATKKLVLLR